MTSAAFAALVTILTVAFCCVVLMAACFVMAAWNGQAVRSVSCSKHRGFHATFYKNGKRELNRDPQ